MGYLWKRFNTTTLANICWFQIARFHRIVVTDHPSVRESERKQVGITVVNDGGVVQLKKKIVAAKKITKYCGSSHWIGTIYIKINMLKIISKSTSIISDRQCSRRALKKRTFKKRTFLVASPYDPQMAKTRPSSLQTGKDSAPSTKLSQIHKTRITSLTREKQLQKTKTTTRRSTSPGNE